MKAWQEYFQVMQEVVQKAYDTQEENLLKAAAILTECTKKGGVIHAFGAGHSGLVTEDIFWRSATLANVHAIFESSVSGINEITKTSYMEKVEGLGAIIVDYQRFQPEDALITISNSGNNAVTIEVAETARKQGIPVIAITNVSYSDYLRTLHSTGRKLKDVVDVVIDNCSIIGDSAIKIPGLEVKVGATSTIPTVYLLNALLVQTAANLVEEGFTPDVYYNGHLTHDSAVAKENNDRLVTKYYYRIRNL